MGFVPRVWWDNLCVWQLVFCIVPPLTEPCALPLASGPTNVGRQAAFARSEGTQVLLNLLRARALPCLFTRATEGTAKTKPVGPAGAATVETATAAAASASERCQGLLRRCFQALLSERDDGVRGHSARLWTELLKGLGR